MDETPNCPKCDSNENVESVRCLCLSCPPWVCKTCPGPLPYAPDHLGYEFYDDEKDDDLLEEDEDSSLDTDVLPE